VGSGEIAGRRRRDRRSNAARSASTPDCPPAAPPTLERRLSQHPRRAAARMTIAVGRFCTQSARRAARTGRRRSHVEEIRAERGGSSPRAHRGACSRGTRALAVAAVRTLPVLYHNEETKGKGFVSFRLSGKPFYTGTRLPRCGWGGVCESPCRVATRGRGEGAAPRHARGRPLTSAHLRGAAGAIGRRLFRGRGDHGSSARADHFTPSAGERGVASAGCSTLRRLTSSCRSASPRTRRCRCCRRRYPSARACWRRCPGPCSRST